MKTKVVRVGNSLGIRLSREIVARMELNEGSELSIVEESDVLRLRKIEPNDAAVIAFADRVFADNDELFRLLAK
jgi:putative addiction module antidote